MAIPSRDEIIAYIKRAAMARGVDPNVAVRVAASEGLNGNPADGWRSTYVANGRREPSYGPFQLYMGGGLGNQFVKDTGLDPRNPETVFHQIDYALDHASKNGWGSWYGAKRVGIANNEGIGGQRVANLPDVRPSSMVEGVNLPAIRTGTTQPVAYTPDQTPKNIEEFKAWADKMKADIAAKNAPADQEQQKLWDSRPLWKNLLDPAYVAAQARSLGKQAGAGAMTIPIDTVGILGNAAATGMDALGVPEDIAVKGLDFADTMSALHEKVNKDIVGVEDPKNLGEALARYSPLYTFAPSIGGILATTALTAGGYVVMSKWNDFTDISKSIMRKAAGKPTATESLGTAAGDAFEQAGVKPTDDPIPTSSLTSKTAEGLIGGVPNPTGELPLDLTDPMLLPDQVVQMVVPTAEAAPQVTDVPAAGGQSTTRRRLEDAKLMGYFGLITLPFMAAPGVARLFKRGLGPRTPRARIISDPVIDPTETFGPHGAKSITTTGDLIQTQIFGATEGFKRILKRADGDLHDLDQLLTTTDLSTHSAGRALVHQALTHGEMDTVAGTFKVNMPIYEIKGALERLPKGVREQFNDYLLAYHNLDDLRRTGRTAVRGATIQSVTQKIQDYERVYPAFKKLKDGVAENVRETRRFLSEGPTAIITRAEARRLNRLTPNWIPHEIDINAGRGYFKRAEAIANPPKTPIQRKLEKPATTTGPMRDPVQALLDYQYTALQSRIENDLAAKSIEYLSNSRYGRGTVIPISKADIKRHGDTWKNHIVPIYKEGKVEHFWAEQLTADTLRFDPYYQINGLTQAFHTAKRMVESGTTGYFAPWFPPLQSWRDVHAAKITRPLGMKGTNAIRAVIAVPRQMGPRALKIFSEAINRSLNANNEGWFLKALGPQRMKLLSDNMARAFHNSAVGGLEKIGSYNVAWTQHQIRDQTDKMMAQLTSHLPPSARVFHDLWASMTDSMQNAVPFSFATRNIKKGNTPAILAHNRQVIRETRKLTGDVTVGGQTYIRRGGRVGKVSADTVRQGPVSKFAPMIVGPAAEMMRIVVPWGNPMLQGMRRMGQAYMDNPIRFTGRVYAHVIVPAASSYLWNATLDAMLIASGQPPVYVEHMMERRGDYNRSLYYYWGNPWARDGRGRHDPSKGFEIPIPHELSTFKRLTEVAMDHFYRPTAQVFTPAEDTMAALHGLWGYVIDPSQVPLIGTIMGAFGYAAPQNLFGAGGYTLQGTIRPDETLRGYLNTKPSSKEGAAFQHLNLPDRQALPGLVGVEDSPQWQTSIEQMVRSLGGAIVDIAGSAMVGMNDPTEVANSKTSLTSKIVGGAKEAEFQLLRKIPLVSGIAGTKPLNTQTQIQSELWRYRPLLDNLSKHLTGVTKYGEPGLPPNNPLFIMFAKEVNNRLNTETQSEAVKGVPSLWARYGDLTGMIQSLRLVNSYNLDRWKKRVESTPELKAYADQLGIDMTKRTDPIVWINALERQQQNIAKRLVVIIKQTEDAMTEAAKRDPRLYAVTKGGKVRIDDLEPYVRR